MNKALIAVILYVSVSCTFSKPSELNFNIINSTNEQTKLWVKHQGLPKFNAKTHSDGCSGGMSALYSKLEFLHSEYGKKLSWHKCCEEHDIYYYYGGTKAEKKSADNQLNQCVSVVIGNKFLGKAMQIAVEIGGGPNLPTPYRWGYGVDYVNSESN